MSHTRDVSRDQLRQDMRKRRRSLSPAERRLAAQSFRTIAQRFRMLRPGMHVALYNPYGSEADCAPLIDLARARGCKVYVPRIVSCRDSEMQFVAYRSNSPLRLNRHGIGEPRVHSGPLRPINRLDLVVLPVVAVDQRGYRLGSGAGFYDRALQHLREGRGWRKPKLIALAYDLQRIDHLDAHPWDVPVDAILTETGLYRLPINRKELPQ
jgi:5-formyltetrahydrofolate cyclo-ligase